jgi:hypothetical protein
MVLDRNAAPFARAVEPKRRDGDDAGQHRHQRDHQNLFETVHDQAPVYLQVGAWTPIARGILIWISGVPNSSLF